MRSSGWALIQHDWCPYKKSRCTWREGRVKTQGEESKLQSKEPGLSTLPTPLSQTSGSRAASEYVSVVSLPGLWHFSTAALANSRVRNSILFHIHPHVINSFLNKTNEDQGPAELKLMFPCAE